MQYMRVRWACQHGLSRPRHFLSAPIPNLKNVVLLPHPDGRCCMGSTRVVDVEFSQRLMNQKMDTSSRDVPSPEPGVSKLAAKVAHELNNPLDAVLRYVSLAQRKVKAGDYADLDRYLNDAQFGLQRMAEILRDLMDIGRDTDEILRRPAPLALDELLSHARRSAALLAEQRRVKLDFHSQTHGSDLCSTVDLRLAQVLANLLKNAIEASPEDSVVEIHSTIDSTGLTLTVIDGGHGIPETLLQQLFSAFSTSKPKGSGHGLGLAISRELMNTLGGQVEISNRPAPDHGCIAKITLATGPRKS